MPINPTDPKVFVAHLTGVVRSLDLLYEKIRRTKTIKRSDAFGLTHVDLKFILGYKKRYWGSIVDALTTLDVAVIESMTLKLQVSLGKLKKIKHGISSLEQVPDRLRLEIWGGSVVELIAALASAVGILDTVATETLHVIQKAKRNRAVRSSSWRGLVGTTVVPDPMDDDDNARRK